MDCPPAEHTRESTPCPRTVRGELTHVFKYDFVRVIITSLLFVTALSWNSTFKRFFDSFPILQRNGLWLYSTIVTVVTLLAARAYQLYLDNSHNSPAFLQIPVPAAVPTL